MLYAIGIITAYLLGSIPVGFLLAKLAGRGDIRNVGSGGTGATNVMRVGGFKLAGATWALDMAKSIVAVFIGVQIGGIAFGAVCGLISIVGHCWPVWLKFKGGKGISSMFGTLLAISPVSFVVCGIVWLLIAFGTGYSSLGAVIAMAAIPIMGFMMGVNIGFIFIAIALVCLWRHRENIKRLLSGTESKIEWKWSKR
jgi:glycerol-3-phosphate acyltransferase PlsY